MNYLSIAFRTQVLNLVSLLFIAFMAMPFVSEAQNQKTIIASDTEFSELYFLNSYPAGISDHPSWTVGDFPDWTEVSIFTEIIENENEFESILNYYLKVTGNPQNHNLGEHLITANLINPWTGDIIEVIETIFEVIEMEECVCPMIYSPVCGADGRTYGNACEASCKGVAIIDDGECETETCICTEQYEPVCGADGKTYSNSCFAACEGVAIVADGECETETCICTYEYDPVCGADGKTYGNACEADCEGVDIIADGECETETCICTEQYEPVCGADGKTYSNSCFAACEDVEILSEGACNTNSLGCQVEDKFYELGESFNIECNSCFCSEGPDGSGLVACTEMACLDGCYDDEKNHYEEGESWNKDVCTTCYCENGETLCVALMCVQPYCDNPIYSDDTCCPTCPVEEGCYDAAGLYYQPGQEWNPDDCTFCSCEQGEFICAVVDCAMPNCENPIYIEGECCPTCPDEEGCYDPAGLYYQPGQEWNPDDCTFCSCEQGDIICAVAACEEPNCTDPVYIDGQCCPTCPDNCENKFDELINYGETFGVTNCDVALAAIKMFGLDCNTNLSEYAYLLGIEIEGEITLAEFCPCSCEDSGGNSNCIYDSSNSYDPTLDGEPCMDPCAVVDCMPGYICVNGDCIGPVEPGCLDENKWLHPIGAILEDDCKTCYCETSNDPIKPDWICEETSDCSPCVNVDCTPGMYCEMGECIPYDNTDFGCQKDDEWYAFGTEMEQGCNHCVCTPGFNPEAEGVWSCTKMACEGCTDANASNYDEYAVIDDNSCEYECPNVCCMAMIASCLACSECMSIEEYCHLNPDTQGCPVTGCTDPEANNYNANAEIGDNSCEYSQEPNWDFVVTGNNHTLILPESILSELLSGNPLEDGDKVGVFFSDNGELVCAGYTIWDGATTVIPAQGDDLTTDVKDGFGIGETFQWMVWDVSENLIADAEVRFTTIGEENFAINGISTLAEITAVPLIQDQEIELKAGWNMFSTYMKKHNMKIKNIFHEFVQHVIIAKNNFGHAYLPEWDFDGIDNMIPGQAYQTKMKEDQMLQVDGEYTKPEKHPITLTNGWNMIGYLRTSPAPTISVFADVEDLVIVKDNVGMAYLPEFDFDGIGMMTAGQGYQVKVLSEQVLHYASNKHEYRYTTAEVKSELEHFNQPLNTGSNMTLVLPESAWLSSPKEADEIAVFDAEGILVGAMPYQESHMVIPIYGNDELTTKKDGLNKDEAFQLVLWSDKHQKETQIEVQWSEESLGYEKDQIAYASELEFTHELEELHSVNVFPNPTNDKTELQATLTQEGELQISIFNLLGKEVFHSVKTYPKGPLEQVLDIEHLAAGSYLLHLKTKNEFHNKNLIVK